MNFLEQLFGIPLDGGNGQVEILIFLLPGLIVLLTQAAQKRC